MFLIQTAGGRGVWERKGEEWGVGGGTFVIETFSVAASTHASRSATLVMEPVEGLLEITDWPSVDPTGRMTEPCSPLLTPAHPYSPLLTPIWLLPQPKLLPV